MSHHFNVLSGPSGVTVVSVQFILQWLGLSFSDVWREWFKSCTNQNQQTHLFGNLTVSGFWIYYYFHIMWGETRCWLQSWCWLLDIAVLLTVFQHFMKTEVLGFFLTVYLLTWCNTEQQQQNNNNSAVHGADAAAINGFYWLLCTSLWKRIAFEKKQKTKTN